MIESVILCEGYHDRAFWAGWLTHLGCSDPGHREGGRRRDVYDPWGKKVAGGQFAFDSQTDKFVRIIPCHGESFLRGMAKSRLRDREDRELDRLVFSVDADTYTGTGNCSGVRLNDQAVEGLVREFGEATQNEHGDRVLGDTKTTISVVRWQTDETNSPGLPDKQTLERVVCAALAETFADRPAAVQGWLDSRPDGPDTPAAGPKEFAWSYMAGWYAELGCDAFYRTIWENESVAAALKSRLESAGAWRVAQALAE